MGLRNGLVDRKTRRGKGGSQVIIAPLGVGLKYTRFALCLVDEQLRAWQVKACRLVWAASSARNAASAKIVRSACCHDGEQQDLRQRNCGCTASHEQIAADRIYDLHLSSLMSNCKPRISVD
jgi:hypothetical protein